MKHEETYTSTLHTHVHFFIYEPQVIIRVKAVLFVQHDLNENASNYDHFANFMCDKGYVVVVSDMVGHGHSLIDFEQGYFGKTEVLDHLMKDMHHLQKVMMARYTDTPYFYIGTGLGAQMIREYAARFGDYFQGMLLIGAVSGVRAYRYKNLCLNFFKLMKGERYHLNKLALRSRLKLSRRFNEDHPFSYLTDNEKLVDRFSHDTLTNFSYTVKGYSDIYKISRHANSEETYQKTPTYLSTWVASGALDPLTRLGKDAQLIYHNYKTLGMSDITLKIYDNKRHALLFGKDRINVYTDILTWLNARTYI